MIPKMLRRRKARSPLSKTSVNQQEGAKAVGIQARSVENENKENSASCSAFAKRNNQILRPAVNNGLIEGTSMISYAMASSQVARSLDGKTAENELYRPETSTKEAQVVHPVVCKRDIFIGRGSAADGAYSIQEAKKPKLASVSASMICRQMDQLGGDAQFHLRGGQTGIVDPHQLYGGKSAIARSRLPRIVTAEPSPCSSAFGPSSTVSELSFRAWASPAALSRQVIEEEECPENASAPVNCLDKFKAEATFGALTPCTM